MSLSEAWARVARRVRLVALASLAIARVRAASASAFPMSFEAALGLRPGLRAACVVCAAAGKVRP